MCSRIDFNFQRMNETAALLWDAGEAFGEALCATPLCLPHFAYFLEISEKMLKSKSFAALYRALYATESEYIEKIRTNTDGFARKFDYRYAGEPWNGEENAVPEALAALNGTNI